MLTATEPRRAGEGMDGSVAMTAMRAQVYLVLPGDLSIYLSIYWFIYLSGLFLFLSLYLSLVIDRG